MGALSFRLAGLEGQRHFCDAAGNVETLAAFEAERLQRDWITEAAKQHIRADPDPNAGASGSANVSARQQPRPGVVGRREHRPSHNRALHVSNIDPEFADRANVMLRSYAIGSKGAVDGPRRAEDEAEPAGDVASHNTGLHRLRLGGRSERQYTADYAEGDDRDH